MISLFNLQVTEILTPPVTLFSAIKEGNMNTFEDMLNSGNADVDQTNKVSFNWNTFLIK